MWVKIFSSFILNQNQYYYISVELDFYFIIYLVSILFINFLDLFFCMKKKHQHVVSNFENVNKISSTIYRIYYLKFCIINDLNMNILVNKKCAQTTYEVYIINNVAFVCTCFVAFPNSTLWLCEGTSRLRGIVQGENSIQS